MKYPLTTFLFLTLHTVSGQDTLKPCLAYTPPPDKCNFSYWKQTNYATRNGKSRLVKQYVSEVTKNDTVTTGISRVLREFYGPQKKGITKNVTLQTLDKKYLISTNWERKRGKFIETSKREVFSDSLLKTTIEYRFRNGKEIPFSKTVQNDSSDKVSFERTVSFFENGKWQPRIFLTQYANNVLSIKVSHTYRFDTLSKKWNLSDYTFLQYDEQCRIIYDSSFHYDGNYLRSVQLRKKIPSDTAFIMESISNRFDTIPHPEWAKNDRSRAIIRKWVKDSSYTVNTFYTFNDSLQLFIPDNQRISKADTLNKTSVDTLFRWDKTESKWQYQFKSNSYTDSLGIRHSLSCNYDIGKKEWEQGNIQEVKMFCDWHLQFQKTYAWRGDKRGWVCYSYLENVYK